MGTRSGPLLGAVLVALALAGCGAAPAEPSVAPDPAAPSGTATFPVTVEHTFGTTTIASAPQRVVTLGATDADVLLALGVTPVGIGSPYTFPRGVGVWAEDELGSAAPTVMGREINYEAIAALAPDLILDVVSGREQARYDTLSRIAPTVALPVGALPHAASWQASTSLIARALGRDAAGAELVRQTESYLAGVAAANPSFAGRTLTYIDAFGAEVYAGGREATAVQLMGELGFQLVPYLQDLPTDETQILVSNELVGQLDADVALIFPFRNTEEQALAQSPSLAALSVVRDGRAYWLTDVGLSSPSVLSIPYGVAALLPFLQDATG